MIAAYGNLGRMAVGDGRRRGDLLGRACALALVAMSVFAVANASAAAPEFGMCTKEASATHVYKNANCTKVSSGSDHGEYEWYPGAEGGSSVRGTTTVTMQLEPSGDLIECTESVGEDQYKGPKELDMILIFSGCQFGGNSCKSGGEGAGQISSEGWLEGELLVYKSYSNPIKDEVALVLEQGSGEPFFTPFTCGSTTFKTKGELMVPVETNLMQLTSILEFKQSGGVQIPNDSGYYTLTTQVNSGSPEETGIEFKVEDTADQEYEVNTVVP